MIASPAGAAASPDVTADVTSINFGTQLADGSPGTSYVITLTDVSANAQTLGTAAISGASAQFEAPAALDTCSGVTLAAGRSCTISVDPVVPDTGVDTTYTGTLSLPVTTGADGDTVSVNLSVTGSTHGPFDAVPGPGYADVVWGVVPTITSAAISGPPSGYAIMRGTGAGSLTQIATIDDPVATTTYRDSSVTPGTEYFYAVEPIYNGSPVQTAPAIAVIPWQPGSPGTYIPLPSARILDTRTTIGGHPGPVVAGQPVTLQVTGRGGVPNTGVGSVVLNLTGTNVSLGLAVTAWPADKPRPNTSVLNIDRNDTRANMVTVALSASGQIHIVPLSGSLNVIADVVGFYASEQTQTSIAQGGQFFGLPPVRIEDTRSAQYGPTGPLASHGILRVPIGDFGTLDGSVRAAIVNITETGGTAPGYLTAIAAGSSVPNASTLNFANGSTNPNMAIVPVGPCTGCADPHEPAIDIYNGSTAGVQVIVDLVGIIDDDTVAFGAVFQSLANSTRLVDTRTGTGLPGPLGPGKQANVDPSALLGEWTVALDTNLTAVGATAGTYLTVWPTDLGDPTPPLISNLNAGAGQTVPNHTIAMLGDNGLFSVYNNRGTTNVLVDVDGTFDLRPFALPPGAAAAARPNSAPSAASQTPTSPFVWHRGRSTAEVIGR